MEREREGDGERRLEVEGENEELKMILRVVLYLSQDFFVR